MKPEENELLLKDLCGRLSYGVICKTSKGSGHLCSINQTIFGIEYGINIKAIERDYFNDKEEIIKPYLRPMSSMTEEEKKELDAIIVLKDDTLISIIGTSKTFDYLNKKMFDFRGLIPKGLAEIAPEGMYELNYSASQNESDSVIDNTTKITVGCKIRSKTNPNEILSIISDDCHGDEFECANGDVLSLKQIEKYYELIK